MAHLAPPRVTIGVDTHLDLHVAHAKDQLGRRLATVSVPTTPAGYRSLLAWARGLGEVEAFGVEGTGSYGAALARFLRAQGQVVVEVNRPDRQARRRRGKSDPLDAEAAARSVQAGEATVAPKAGDGVAEMLRCLRVARASAVKARTQAGNAIKALLVTAPAELREQLRGLPTAKLVATAAAFPAGKPATPTAATMLALRLLAVRHQGAHRRGHRPGPRAGTAHRQGSPEAARPVRRRRGIGRGAAGSRWRQSRSAAQRGGLRDAVRQRADPGVLGQDRAPSPQPGR